MVRIFDFEDWKHLTEVYCQLVSEYIGITIKQWPIQLNTQASSEVVREALKELSYLLDIKMSEIPSQDIEDIANALFSITEILGRNIKAHKELFVSAERPLSYALLEAAVVVWTTFNSFILHNTPHIPRRLAVYNLLRGLAIPKKKTRAANKRKVLYCQLENEG